MLKSFVASVLVVSATDKITDFLIKTLPQNQFYPMTRVKSCDEAKRILVNKPYDIVIINSPLPDSFGTELAIDIANNYNTGVLLLTNAEVYEQVTYKVENYGVLTLTRPCTSHAVFQSLKLLVATEVKLRVMEERTATLEEKMKEIRLVNKAKSFLIETKNMTESEAHRFIEKSAMDSCCKKIDIANQILGTA